MAGDVILWYKIWEGNLSGRVGTLLCACCRCSPELYGDLPEERLLVLKLMLTLMLMLMLMLMLLPTDTARGLSLPASLPVSHSRSAFSLTANLSVPLAAPPGGKKDLPAASLRQRFLPGVFVFRI